MGSKLAATATGGLTSPNIAPSDVSRQPKGLVKSVQMVCMVGCSLFLFFQLSFHHDLVHSSADEENEAIQKQALQQSSTALQAGGLGTRQRGTCRSGAGVWLSPIGLCRKRSSSDASLLLTSGRGSVSGRSQPAARHRAQREAREEGKTRWQEREWGGRKRSEARRGRSSRAGAQDSTRPSVRLVPPQPAAAQSSPVSVLSVRPSRAPSQPL